MTKQTGTDEAEQHLPRMAEPYRAHIDRDTEPSLEEKVALLSSPSAYPWRPASIHCRETHMSWIFLTGPYVAKLKKPIRLPYLDFSTLARREAACRAELAVNRRLAPSVYIDVVPLTASPQLAINGDGPVVDWLVIMRQLDERLTLDNRLRGGTVRCVEIDRLATLLARFYRHAKRSNVSVQAYRRMWLQRLAANQRVLQLPGFDLPRSVVRRIDAAQRRFLREGEVLLRERVRHCRIVDGHGDLRPEHIWLNHPIKIIDALEFDRRLRQVDPFDEVAYLDIESHRLGITWVGERLRQQLGFALNDVVSEVLFEFYRCYRATLRARLSIAHLLNPTPRTPEKWAPQARAYLTIADCAARELERRLNSPTDR